MQLTGAEAVVRCLAEEGVDTVFGYPGGQIMPLYDALYDSPLRHILTVHEQGAVHAADGYARASGRVGVCIATSGPGATNLVTGLAAAHLDSVPLVAITGQVPTTMLGRDSFQEVDFTGVTMSVTKHNFLVKDAVRLPDIMRAGVFSVKFEGRMKSAEYVANIIRVYRQALDRVYAEMTGPNPPANEAEWMKGLYAQVRYDLEMAFSRGGLYTGWLRGNNNQKLVHARFGTKRGVYLGEVSGVQGGKISISLLAPLKAGDGVVFDAGNPEEKEEGGRVYKVETHGAESTLMFGNRNINFYRIHKGDKLWKTSDPELDGRLRESFAGEQPHFTRPIDVEVIGREGEPLTIRAHEGRAGCPQHAVEVHSTMPLIKAQKQPLTEQQAR
jgi:hypothetical protein